MAAFEDAFSDTEPTALENHTPDVGTGWSLISGTTTVFEIRKDTSVDGEIDATSSTNDGYHCDDQGSADHITIGRMSNVAWSGGHRDMFMCVRLTDYQNHIGWRWYGTGSLGSRVTKVNGGSRTDLITQDGAEANIREGWVKVEAEGDSIELFHGGTGSSPSWVSQASVTDSFNNTETRQGVVKDGGGLLGLEFLDNFQADPFSTGQTVTVGLVTETESALAPTAAKTQSIGLVTESEAALPLGSGIVVGLVTETEQALGVTPEKSVSASLVTETEQALSASPSKVKSLGLVTEIESALSVSALTLASVGLVAETETALSVTYTKSGAVSVGVVTEAEIALSPTVLKDILYGVGVARETEIAPPVAVKGWLEETGVQGSWSGAAPVEVGWSEDSGATGNWQ